MLIAVSLQIVLPLLLLFYFITGTKTALSMMVRGFSVAGIVWAVRTMATYLVLPWYVFYLYFAALVIIALLAVFFRRQITFSPRRRAAVVLRIDMVVALVVANLNIYLLLGEAPDYSNIVSLEPPVLGQSVYVMNGGTHSLVNDHIPSFMKSRLWTGNGEKSGSYYAIDLIVVSDDGRPNFRFFPESDFDYVGYNALIYAPCTGIVQSAEVEAVDGESDSALGQMVIECGSFDVLMAHLEPRSLALQPGARVREGQQVGTLGVARQGFPPYLHLQVHRREIQTNGDVRIIPVQVTIGNNFLARGDLSP